MAYDPNNPYDDYADPYLAWAQQQPPIGMQQIGPALGGQNPVPDEYAQGVPSLSPEEQAQIEIDQPAFGAAGQVPATQRLTPDEEAQIQIDEPEKPGAEEADAISGADMRPGVSDLVDVTGVDQQQGPPQPGQEGYLEWAQQHAAEQPLPSQQEQATAEATQKAVEAMSPEDFARYQAARQGALEARQAELQHKANLENEARARQDLEDQRQAIAKANADTQDLVMRSDQLARTKIDPERYKNTRSTGQAAADFVGIVLGGMFSGGGPNMALAQFNRKIDNDIDAQKADIQNAWQGISTRKGAIASELERHGDLYKAQESYRIAAYTGAINDMQTQLQQFDPNGATAIRMRQSLDQLGAARQQALAAYNKTQFDQNLSMAKEQRERAVAASTIDKNAADIAKTNAEMLKLKAAGMGGGAAKKPEDQKLTPPELQALHPGAPVPPIAMSLKEYKGWLETNKLGEENIKATRENKMGSGGTEIRNPVTGEPLAKEDGTPIVAGSVEQAKEINEGNIHAQNLVDALSDARRFLASDPSAFSRSEWAALGTKLENAKVAYIESHKAKASSREMEAVHGIFGPDFEKLRDRLTEKGKSLARIDALLDLTRRETGTALKGLAGYKGKTVLLDTSKPPASAPTSTDAATETLAHDPDKAKTETLSPDDLEYKKFQDAQPKHTPFGIGVQSYDGPNDAVKRADRLGMFPSKVKAFDALEAQLKDPDRRNAALEALLEQANNGESKAIRHYAQDLLQGLLRDLPPASVDEPGVQ